MRSRFENVSRWLLAFSCGIFFQENVHGRGDGRAFLGWGFHVKSETGIDDRVGSCIAECADGNLTLLKIRVV